MQPSTFSIVAFDPAEEAFGVAVASKFPAVGAVVPWARSSAGAVATQAHANLTFGPRGLDWMEQGKSAAETLALLLDGDPMADRRQVGLVDRQGRAAAHTGSQCFDWAGHRVGEGFTCQGNILASARVVEAMADAFAAASGELADRLLAALRAGDEAGGDRRGRQSAALQVVRPGGGYGGDNDRYLDLRVDDHVDPMGELARLVGIHHLFFGKSRPEDQLPITEDLARELQTYLRDQGYLQREPTGVWDDASKHAFDALIGNENLEERWSIVTTPDRIDRPALEYLRQRFARS